MKEYRIVKIEKLDAVYKDRMDISFKIQQKFLWWWFDRPIKCCYFHSGPNGGITSNAIIEKRNFIFRDTDNANKFLEKYIINPFVEHYKKNKIIRIPQTYNREDIYINISKFYSNYNGYEYAYSLNELKTKIDRRTTKPKLSVIK